MARFVFRLEAVLRQREAEHRAALERLGHAQAQVAAIENELRELQRQSDETARWMRDDQMTGPINLQVLATHRRYVNSVASVGRASVQRLAIAKRSADAVALEVAEVAKRLKVIEKLRDRDHEQWLADRKRKQQVADDETATQMSFANREAET
ncbi:MAG: flagellar FliJ family protein [Planctomycetota bacterium]